jgi:hypothetical protein
MLSISNNGATQTAIKFNAKFLTVDGQRIGVTYATGPWVPGVDPATIKILPKRYAFPACALLSQATYSNRALGEYLADAAHKVALADREAA